MKDNLELVQRKEVYIDLVGDSHNSLAQAGQVNHEIHLRFRKYIEEELLKVFDDTRYDKLGTTKSLWDALEFTPECIAKINQIMLEKP